MLTCDNIFSYGMSVFMNLISKDNLMIFLPPHGVILLHMVHLLTCKILKNY